MNLVIIGVIGLDDIETPFGSVKDALGGCAVYSSCAASFFAKAGVSSIAGNDLPSEYRELLLKRDIDTEGIIYEGKNFRWSGSYAYDMNSAETLTTELNSLANFSPILPENYKKARYLMLGNTDPDIQLSVIDQFAHKPFIVIDTMNYWISSKRESLLQVISKSDLVVINEGEARQLFDTPNLIKAGKMLLQMGPKYAIIKKGEHGALLFSDGKFFSAPSYPLETVKDPTGCGDSFAGGLIGYLADVDNTSEESIRRGIIYGSVIASFCAEDFSLNYLEKINREEIEKRYNEFEEIRRF
ncbi:MAG: PfkB family carbohydrate kinase [bacterium]